MWIRRGGCEVFEADLHLVELPDGVAELLLEVADAVIGDEMLVWVHGHCPMGEKKVEKVWMTTGGVTDKITGFSELVHIG